MPKISEFFGILIFMYFDDHNPPHFHAQYQNYMATFFLNEDKVTGKLPPRALRLVEEWRDLRRAALLENWETAKRDGVLNPIEPLE
jgi:hypothetical protein